MDIPKISVRVVTYNHERFIAQALESVLKQETAFTYEIVVVDDCSTDGTPGIIASFAERYPDVVRAVLRKKNIGRLANGLGARKLCRGRYIAILDGDDYWVNADKLQVQADTLDRRPEVSMCCHNAARVDEDDREMGQCISHPVKSELGLDDVMFRSMIPSGSMMYRREMGEEVARAFPSAPMLDWPTQIVCANNGPILYAEVIMSAYRVHRGGVWSMGGDHGLLAQLRRLRWRLKFYRLAAAYLGGERARILRSHSRKVMLEALPGWPSHPFRAR